MGRFSVSQRIFKACDFGPIFDAVDEFLAVLK